MAQIFYKCHQQNEGRRKEAGHLIVSWSSGTTTTARRDSFTSMQEGRKIMPEVDHDLLADCLCVQRRRQIPWEGISDRPIIICRQPLIICSSRTCWLPAYVIMEW